MTQKSASHRKETDDAATTSRHIHTSILRTRLASWVRSFSLKTGRTEGMRNARNNASDLAGIHARSAPLSFQERPLYAGKLRPPDGLSPFPNPLQKMLRGACGVCCFISPINQSGRTGFHLRALSSIDAPLARNLRKCRKSVMNVRMRLLHGGRTWSRRKQRINLMRGMKRTDSTVLPWKRRWWGEERHVALGPFDLMTRMEQRWRDRISRARAGIIEIG